MLKVFNNTTRYKKNVYLEYTFFLYLVVLLTTFNIYKSSGSVQACNGIALPLYTRYTLDGSK